jgi:hypothetical protein
MSCTVLPSLARPLSATNVWWSIGLIEVSHSSYWDWLQQQRASFNFCIKKAIHEYHDTKQTEAPIDQPDVLRKQTGKKTNNTARAARARRWLVEVHRRTPDIEAGGAALDSDGQDLRRSGARCHRLT